MALSLATTITGGAQSGFTSPTYTLASDRPPNPRAMQWLVNTLGGTQTGVRTHSPSDPFTVTTFAPQSFRSKPVVSADGIILGSVAMNEYRMLLRKGMNVYSTNVRNGYIDCKFGIPAGADAVDAANIRALVSLFAGIIATYPGNIGNDLIFGSF